jgi:hypothetical protein
VLGERELARRTVQPQAGGQLTGRDPLHDRLGDGGAERRALRKAVPDQAEGRFVSIFWHV